jgi:NAD(P)-dependent dehydrogenase (short-subunit alcohol dehydrogenase family)
VGGISVRLKGKVAVVTGSSAGIGESIARRFADEGASVLIHGLEIEAGRKIAADITAAGRGQAAFRFADLEDPRSCSELIAAAVASFGGVDILINNAAVKTRDNLDNFDLATFDRTIAVNLRAPVLLIKSALPYLCAHGLGAVINIGSINSTCGERGQFSYSLAKGALMTMTRNLANAHGHKGVRFNYFNVGWVLTPNEYELKMKEGMAADWPQRLPPSISPYRRLLSPEDIAHFALAYVDNHSIVNGTVVDLEQYPLVGPPMVDLFAAHRVLSGEESASTTATPHDGWRGHYQVRTI